MQHHTCQDILNALREAHSIVITAHQRPDGDAIGASVGLATILNANGWDARIAGLAPIPAPFRFLLSDEDMVLPDSEWVQSVEGVVVLDCGAFDRAGAWAETLGKTIPVFNIDHHDSNTLFGAWHWIDSNACSTGEMVYHLAKMAGFTVPPKAADALWVALVTDTGKFAYENTSEMALRIAADLVALGVHPVELERRIYQSATIAELRLQTRALQSLVIQEQGRIASVMLTHRDFDEAGASAIDAQDIVNIPRSLAGVEVAFFFCEVPEENYTKVSVRADSPHDASAFCKRFGGGGHHRAAGCQLEGEAKTVRDSILIAACNTWFSNSPDR